MDPYSLNICDSEELWEDLGKLRSSEQLSDAMVIVEGKRFPVHKAILAAHSSIFQSLFTTKSEQGISDVSIEGMDHSTMEHVLTYIYTKNLVLDVEMAMCLIKTAGKFSIFGLHDYCSDYLISSINCKNCLLLKSFAEKYHCSELAQAVDEYIVTNFYKIIRLHDDILRIPYSDMHFLIQNDKLNVISEEDCFNTVKKWLEFDPDNRSQYIFDLLSVVRLGLFSLDFLLKQVLANRLINENLSCRDLIDRAGELIRYCGQRRKVDLHKPLLRPRIPYTVLFAIGGWTSGAPTGCLETYDTRADSWFKHPLLEDTVPRAYHALVSLGGLIYLMGGFDGVQYYSSTRCFNPLTQTWRDVAPMYSKRFVN